MAQAVAYLLSKRVTRIILARPAVEAGEKLGFLPGDLQEKVNPYLRPLYDALYDMLDAERVERLLERGVIEVAPIAFMRGRTLNDAFVILDEAQNTTSEQMKMFLTRLGLRIEGRRSPATSRRSTCRRARRLGTRRGAQGRRRASTASSTVLLRRPRRRPPSARAADRQGVRGVQRTSRRRMTPRARSSAGPRRLRVATGRAGADRRPRRPSARALARAAPRPRGARHASPSPSSATRAMRPLNRDVPRRRPRRPTCCRFPADAARPSQPAQAPAASPKPSVKHLGDIAIALGVAAPPGPRATGISLGHRTAGSGPPWPSAPSGLRSRAGPGGRCGDVEDRLRRRAGLPAGLIARAPGRTIRR